MTRAEDLLQALNGLQRAADSELSGDAREAASQYVKELFRFAGFDGEDAGEGEGRGEEAVPFAQALAEVRMQAEGELSGNAFELASIIFDDLASLSPSSASAPQEHARSREGRSRSPRRRIFPNPPAKRLSNQHGRKPRRAPRALTKLARPQRPASKKSPPALASGSPVLRRPAFEARGRPPSWE